MSQRNYLASGLRIPAERQSSRIKEKNAQAIEQSVRNGISTRSTLVERNRHVPHPLSTQRGTHVVNEQYEDEEVDEDFEEAAASDDDDTVFNPRGGLPESSVQRWKLSEVVRKSISGRGNGS